MRSALEFLAVLFITPLAHAFEPVATPSVHPWVCGDWTTAQVRMTPLATPTAEQSACVTDADCVLTQDPCQMCWIAVSTGGLDGYKKALSTAYQTVDCAANTPAKQPQLTCNSGLCRPVTVMDAANSCTLYGGTLVPNPAVPGQSLCRFETTGEP
jgi:hypothetical protein